jgi:hypothetical protein
MPITPGRSPSAIMFVVRMVLICRGCFLDNARVIMSVVHVALWMCRLPMEWTGTPPAGWSGHRLPAKWTGLIKC